VTFIASLCDISIYISYISAQDGRTDELWLVRSLMEQTDWPVGQANSATISFASELFCVTPNCTNEVAKPPR